MFVILDFVIFSQCAVKQAGWDCLARNNKTSIKPCNPRIFIIVTSSGWQGQGGTSRQQWRQRRQRFLNSSNHWYSVVEGGGGGTEREDSRKAAYNAGGREVRIRIAVLQYYSITVSQPLKSLGILQTIPPLPHPSSLPVVWLTSSPIHYSNIFFIWSSISSTNKMLCLKDGRTAHIIFYCDSELKHFISQLTLKYVWPIKP